MELAYLSMFVLVVDWNGGESYKAGENKQSCLMEEEPQTADEDA